MLSSLTQRNSDTTALAVGGIAKTTSVQLTASSGPGTCDSTNPTYRVDIEVRPLAVAFTGTPTHQSALMAKPSCVDQAYPFTTVTLPGGSYHWQVREVNITSGAGIWYQFNAGNKAFEIRGGLQATPSSLAFGNQRIGTSGMQSVTVTNTGSTSINVSSITKTGSAFTFSGPAVPFSLAPNATATLAVTFTPVSMGSATGSLSIASNDPSGPTTVTLSGTGVLPAAVLSVTSLNFSSR